MKCYLEFFSYIDLFGKEAELYIKGKSKKSFLIGKIFTFIYIIIYAAFFIYKINRMIRKYDVTFYDTNAYIGEIPSIQATNEIFYGAFALKDANDQPLLNPQIYYIKAQFINSVRKEDGSWDYNGSKELIIEQCRIEKFGSKYQELFKNDKLDNFYCLSEINETLRGYSNLEEFSYIYITVYACKNTTENNNWCYPMDIIDKYLTNNIFTFNIEDIELTPQIYNSPIQIRRKDIIGPVYKNLYQRIYTYMQIVNIETDNNIIGFEGLSNIKSEKYLKYDSSWIIPSPNDGKTYEKDINQPVCEITIQLAANILTQKRSYTQLIEVLGDVGGLMEFLSSFFNIICNLIIDILYEKSLVNNLFSFDLNKNAILIKNNNNKILKEKDIFPENKEPKMYVPIKQISLQNSFNLNDKSNPPKNKNNLNEDDIYYKNFTKKVVKRKKRTSSQKTGLYIPNLIEKLENEGSKQIFENKNIKDNKKLSINNINIYNIKEKEEIIVKENNIINEIQINKICIYLFFCFARKRKNINNILLDECMNIVTQKLDILNLFRNLYKDEKMQIKFDIKDELIQMSNECIINLKNIQKNV